jgi:putative ABC transport system permease protein
MIRSFVNVYTADVGVNTANVLTMSLYTPAERYASSEEQLSFYQGLGTRLQALPGVESVGFGTAAPTDYTPRVAYELADAPAVEEQSRPTVAQFVVSTGYFRTLGARIISGREFDDSDRASSLPVAIVNQRFASRNWPGEIPLGKRLRLSSGREPTPWLTVVGVLSNVVQNDRTRQESDSVVYLPYQQTPQRNMFAFARTSVGPGSLATAFRRQIYAMDPYLPVPALMPLAERFDRAYAFERNITVLFLVFAAIALLLASVGLYAVISRSVSRRSQEIGVRMAVGATAGDIRELVLRQGMLPVGVGLIIGLAASFAVNRVLNAQLVGVSPSDPVTLVVAFAVLIFSAMLGCWIPARRAMRVDPVVALRHE